MGPTKNDNHDSSNGCPIFSKNVRDDEAGHLLGEYDATGTLIEETVWLGDIPIATLKPSGATVAIYYVHTDGLNTPASSAARATIL